MGLRAAPIVTLLGSAAVLAACGRVGFDDHAAIDARADADADSASPMPDAAHFATPALVQQLGTSGSTSMTQAATLDSDVLAGDTLIVAYDVSIGPPLPSLVSLADTLGSTFTIVVGPYNDGSTLSWIASAPILTAGHDTVTVIIDTPGGFPELRVHEMSGLAAVGAFDVGSTSNGPDSPPAVVTAAPVTTTLPNELVFAVILSGVDTAGAGYTLASAVDADVAEYLVATTPGTYAPTANVSTGARWTATVAAFRAATQP